MKTTVLFAAFALVFIAQKTTGLAKTASENLEAFADQKATQEANGIPNLVTFNANISATKLWEQNLKSANALYLQFLAGNIYTSNDSIALFGIANQCPTIGGEGVYLARSLFSMLNDYFVFDDELLCANLGLRKSEQGHSTTIAELSLFPNPTIGKFYVDGLDGSTFHYEIANSLGTVVETGHKSDGWFNIGRLVPGFYVLSIKEASQSRSMKFVVSD